MRSVRHASLASTDRRQGTLLPIAAGRKLICAALLASTAMVSIATGTALAEDLVIDGNDQEEITAPRNLDGGDLVVGDTAGSDATLTISDGGQLESDNTLIGHDAGSKGTVTVSGSGTLNTEDMLVGDTGDGTLIISDGGSVTTRIAYVGTDIDTSGTVTVTGTGSSWTNTGRFNVGHGGSGTMTVSDGGSVSGNSVQLGTIGSYSGSGTVTVTGAGSSWTNSSNFTVGHAGEGTLTVSDEGVAGASIFNIARFSGSTGTLIIGAASGEDAQAAGFLQGADGAAAVIEFGVGDGTIVLNHTETDYEFDATVSGDGLFKQEAGNTHLTGDWSGFTGTGEISG
ncbi:hypothetical protein E2A64_17695, partial [Pseudohoeflea suaedae]